MYKVIIVDDESNIRERIASIMPWGELGFEVIGSCENGEDAWNVLQSRKPEAVLTDILMPGMNGLELIGKIRREHPRVMTAIMSAYDDFKYAQAALHYDVKGYLLKPVLRKEFIAVFRKISSELETRANRRTTDGTEPSNPPRTTANPYVSLAVDYVSRHIDERITVEDAAKVIHIHPNYLSTLFKRETGYNFIDYVNEMKIRKAMELLLYTDEKISDIALRIGFYNFSYFNKIFKKIAGETPSQYQETHRLYDKPDGGGWG